MGEDVVKDGQRLRRRPRVAIWGAIACFLMLPALAMSVSSEVRWSATDYVVFGAMLVGAGGLYDLASTSAVSSAYRTAVAIAVAAAFVLIWINLAVGFIGTEANPANLMFGGVLVVGIVGAPLARFRPNGMARALSAMAVVQILVGVIALVLASRLAESESVKISALSGMFTTAWLLSAWLFRRAARGEAEA
jgi:hypothetical protein